MMANALKNLAFYVTCCLAAAPGARAASLPNIFFVVVDDFGWAARSSPFSPLRISGHHPCHVATAGPRANRRHPRPLFPQDVGWHRTAAGAKAADVRTPTMDALVAEGVELGRHYVHVRTPCESCTIIRAGYA